MDIKKPFTAVVASGTASATVDFGTQGYKRVYVNNESTEVLTIQGSGDGSNYYNIGLASSVAGTWTDFDIPTASSGTLVEAPPLPRFVKVLTSSTVANGASVYFVTA